MNEQAPTATASEGRAQMPEAQGSPPHAPDDIDAAIKAADRVTHEIGLVERLEVAIRRDSGSVSGYAIEFPNDLDYEVLSAIMASAFEIGREIIKRGQQPTSPIVLARGNLPTPRF